MGDAQMGDLSRNSQGEAILKAALALAPTIKAGAEEGERIRRLPDPILEGMERAHVFSMAMPREWGGPELDPMEQMRVIEALSEIDASVGWCAMIGIDGGYMSGFLDQALAREMFSDIDTPNAVVGTPTGRAVRAAGGYRVSGRWPFASGCHHAQWIIAGCLVMEDGKLITGPDGPPENRQCFLPRRECEILDTWYTTGLRATGSTDFAINDYFVPEEQTFTFSARKYYRDSPLYRFPAGIILKASAPPLGVARAAIDSVVEAANRQAARGAIVGGDSSPIRLLRDEAYLQDAIGRAEALWGTARSFLYDVVGELWATLVRGDQPDRRQLLRFTLANTQTFANCVQAVELMYKARGGQAVYAREPLDRCLRDVLTMNQHAFVSLRSYGMAGRALLGIPGDVLLPGVL